MARVETIVVGGGIGAGSPFALNFVPIIGSVDPPLLISTDFLFTVPTGANRGLIVGLTDPAAGPERLRVKGGCILEPATGATGTCIGDGNDSGADGQILIGIGITANAQTNTITIGNLAVGASGASGSVVIGQDSSLQGGSGVAINGSCSAGGGVASVAIGYACSAGAGGCVAIGSGNVTVTTGVVIVGAGGTVGAANVTAIGANLTMNASGSIGVGGSVSNAAHTNSITIGNGANAFAAQMLNIGTNVGGSPINLVAFGHGLDTIASPTAVTFRLTNASGADNLAGNFIVRAGLSTGNIATGGNIVFQTGAPGASGVTLQTATTRLTIGQAAATFTIPVVLPAGAVGAPALLFTDADTGLFQQAAGNVAVTVNGVESARFSGGAAGETNFMLFDIDNATLERVSVGAADSGGAGFKLLRIPN